jgi:polar amino acid transport system permease protein
MDVMHPRPATDPGPPGASIGWRWSGIPWWLIALIATVAVIAVKVITDPTWNEGFGFIWNGMSMTLLVTAAGFVIAVVMGLFIGLARISKNTFLSNLAMYYIEFIRGVPVIVTIFFFSLVVWGQWLNGLGFPIPSQPVRATLALGFIYAAFIAEVFRAGIESVSTGQREAGESVGLSKRQVLRFIVLPQAIRNIMPALGNDLIALLKDSSLVSILAVRELTQMTKLWTGTSFHFMEGYIILTGYYLVLTVSLSLLLRWYERRIQVPGH